MTSKEKDHPTYTPANWRTLHAAVIAAEVEDITAELREEFLLEGYDAFFNIWGSHDYRGGKYNGMTTFIGMGIRRSGRQANGNRYSILFAFGFYYEETLLWPDGHVSTLAARAIAAYEGFLDGSVDVCKINIYKDDNFKPQPAPAKSSIDWDAMDEDDEEDYDPLS